MKFKAFVNFAPPFQTWGSHPAREKVALVFRLG